ncbi:MAG: hypothetical protein JJ879_15195 [Sneathiella sp.]|nr:hypothetical protein [Sneathiella sp.]
MKAAFLSGSLISSKGMAGPATQRQAPQELLAQKAPVQAKQPTPTPTPSRKPTAQAAPPAGTDIREDRTYRQLKQQNQKLKRDDLGRVRMSLRLDPEEHLTLKLLSAYAHQTAQQILEQALKEYVANHGDEILPNSCNCIRDRVFK